VRRVSDWFEAGAKKTLGDAVRSIESKSAAEVVVTVRRRSADYFHAELAVGSLFGAAALIVYAYAPVEFDDDVAPLLILLAYCAGAVLTRALPPLKRLFTRDVSRRRAVSDAARTAFLDQGIDRTRARTGMLVYLSLLERRAELVCDRGVPHADIPEWKARTAELQALLEEGAAPAAFAAKLVALGDVLGKALPVTADDVNELPDEVVS